jgi:hypothetical protein
MVFSIRDKPVMSFIDLDTIARSIKERVFVTATTNPVCTPLLLPRWIPPPDELRVPSRRHVPRTIELQRRVLINHAVPHMILQQRTKLRTFLTAPRIRRRIRRVHHDRIDIETARFAMGRIVLVEIGGEKSDLCCEVEIGA